MNFFLTVVLTLIAVRIGSHVLQTSKESGVYALIVTCARLVWLEIEVAILRALLRLGSL